MLDEDDNSYKKYVRMSDFITGRTDSKLTSNKMVKFILFFISIIVIIISESTLLIDAKPSTYINILRKPVARILVAAAVASAFPLESFANTREVGNMATSGFIFKDTLKISAFEDPKIEGITLYLADFERPITEKLAKDFFNDPSSSSLSCAQTGPVNTIDITKKISTDASGEEVFEESKNLFFKVAFS